MPWYIWYFLQTINILTFLYFILLNFIYLFTSTIAFRFLRKYNRQLKSINTEDLLTMVGVPPISLIVPSYNEEATCVQSIKSFLTLKYPDYEILVVNDGSKDSTRDRLIEAYEMSLSPRAPVAQLQTAPIRGIYQSRRQPKLWLIDKENGGKADAINVGISFCRTPLLCVLDADSLLEKDALLRLVRPFLSDKTTIAAGGAIRIVNDCTVRAGIVTEVRLPKNLLARFQVLEYLRAFLSGRMGWHVLKSMLIISGAFGLFKRTAIVEIGGFHTNTIGEDMEATVRLHRHFREKKRPYSVAFVPDAVAWTECPETLKILGNQRDRWQRGLMETMFRHIRMLLNPRYGRIGLFAYPYFFFLEMLGPIIEIFGYIAFFISLCLGIVNTPFAIAFLLAAIVFGITLSIAAVGLEEVCFRRYPHIRDLLHLFYLSIIENLGYRQLNAYYRMRGVYSKFRGKKGWGKMIRKGFSAEKPS